MSPVFAHGALRLYLLSLLAESSMHGYEIMQALERRFGGTYQPSAGTIYPRLSRLEEEGLVSKEADGRRTRYSITDAGRAHLAERGGELDALETELGDSVRRLADEVRGGVRDAMRTLRADLAAAERDARTGPARPPESSTGPDADERSRPMSASRMEARDAVREVDLALARMRADVRRLVRSSTATTEAIARARDEIDAATGRIRAALEAS